MKIKKSDKKSAFIPYSPDEKMYFQKLVPPAASVDAAEDPGKRALTAMDDFMQSMKYAEKVVKVGPPVHRLLNPKP